MTAPPHSYKSIAERILAEMCREVQYGYIIGGSLEDGGEIFICFSVDGVVGHGYSLDEAKDVFLGMWRKGKFGDGTSYYQ